MDILTAVIVLPLAIIFVLMSLAPVLISGSDNDDAIVLR